MQGLRFLMNKIIIFESKTDSLRTFARLMAEGFEEAGYHKMHKNHLGKLAFQSDFCEF